MSEFGLTDRALTTLYHVLAHRLQPTELVEIEAESGEFHADRAAHVGDRAVNQSLACASHAGQTTAVTFGSESPIAGRL